MDTDNEYEKVNNNEVGKVTLSRKERKIAQPTPEVKLLLAAKEKSFRKGAVDVKIIPDSGACASIICRDLAESLGLVISKADTKLVNAEGGKMTVQGRAEVFAKIVRYEGEVHPIDVLVVDVLNNRFLLSWFHMAQLGLLHPTWPAPYWAIRMKKRCRHRSSRAGDHEVEVQRG